MENATDLENETISDEASQNPFQAIANAMAAVGTVWVFLMMLLIVADVLGRNFFDAPITGVAEFAARSVASIVFLQLASAISSGRMTRSDFLLRYIEKKSPVGSKFLEIFNVLIGSFLFIALAYISWPHLVEAMEIKEFFGVQGVFTVLTWPFRALIVFGSILAAVAYLGCIPALLRKQSSLGVAV